MANGNGKNGSTDRLTLVVSNLIKLVGLVIACNEVFGHTEPRSGVLALVALMLAGAQGIEAFVRGWSSK